MDLFLLPLPKASGNFFPIFTVGNWLRFWRQISQYCWNLPMTGSSCLFYILVVSTLSLQGFFSYILGFPTLALVPVAVSTPSLCFGKLQGIFLSVSPSSGVAVCPMPSSLYGSKKSGWFFHLFSFLFVFRAEWWHSSSLHAEPETGSLSKLFLILQLQRCKL